MDLEYIPLDTTEFPIEITFILDDVNYNIEFRYNDVNDFYTILIKDIDDNNLFAGRIKYLADVIDVIIDGMPIITRLIPFSPSDILSSITQAINVNQDTFGKTVQLYLL